MILIADSGSTKTDWWLCKDNQKTEKFKTVGLNPYFVSSQQVKEELYKEFTGRFELEGVQKVFFYGAGCSSPAKQDVIKNALQSLFPFAVSEVDHDMLASARALHGNSPGIACILGTGSNACLYDGNIITESLFSLGYMFGDEGSGAHLGKTYISAHLKNRVPHEIKREFDNFYGYTNEEILTNIYKKANPNRFLASFTIFLKNQLHHPFIFDIVEKCFDDFFSQQVSKLSNYRQMRFGCIGSVGFHFKQVLQKSASRHEIIPEIFLISPMEGLLDYHHQ